MPKIMKNRQRFVKLLTVEDVHDLKSLGDYAHQEAGIPYPKAKEMPTIKKVADEFFERYPDANYNVLTDLVRWMKARNKHLMLGQLINSWQFAYNDGFMKILQRGTTNDSTSLAKLLPNVGDPEVRQRMMLASSSNARDLIYEQYMKDTDGGVRPSVLDENRLPFLDSHDLFVGQVVMYQVSLADPLEHGTILGEDADRIIVHHRTGPRHLKPRMIKTRHAGEWVRLMETKETKETKDKD